MPELPVYYDAAETERRARLAAQSEKSKPYNVDKPGAKLGTDNKKGFRFRVMRVKPKMKRKKWNPKRPEFY